jgi:predicted nucleic acid-binding protein
VAFAILDTGVYIDHWERGLHADELRQIAHSLVVRQSAVVLSELRRGARGRAALKLVDSLQRLAPEIWEPTAKDWWTAGELLRTIGDAQDWETHKQREFQNDALLALTALRHSARVVTTNAADFKLLARKLRIEVIAL